MNEVMLEIPEDKFTIDVEKEFLYNLIEKAIQKVGSPKNLYKILVSAYSLTRYNQKAFGDNLRKWQGKKHEIFLDYYLKIGDYIGVKREILYSNIKSIKLLNSKTTLKVAYPLNLNKAWAFIAECIRVEGHLSRERKRVILENTDIDLIQKFKKYLKKIGVLNFRQDLRIKIMVPPNTKLSEINVINAKTNEKNRIYERILKLKNGNKKEIIFIESSVNIGNSFSYLIKTKSDHFNVNIYVPEHKKIRAVSTLKTNLPYQKVTPSFLVMIDNSTLHYILHKNFKIQTGRKSHKIFIPEIIKKLPKEVVKEVINAVLATESTVVPKDRTIAITSLSKKYLEDFQELLLKFNITSSLNNKNKTITICGYKNFEKVSKNFDFILKNKKENFNSLLKSNKILQSPKGLSKALYLKSLSELGTATLIEIRNNAKRSGHSFGQYIKELLDKKYIKITDINWPMRYKITDIGKKYLENHIIYWLD